MLRLLYCSSHYHPSSYTWNPQSNDYIFSIYASCHRPRELLLNTCEETKIITDWWCNPLRNWPIATSYKKWTTFFQQNMTQMRWYFWQKYQGLWLNWNIFLCVQSLIEERKCTSLPSSPAKRVSPTKKKQFYINQAIRNSDLIPRAKGKKSLRRQENSKLSLHMFSSEDVVTHQKSFFMQVSFLCTFNHRKEHLHWYTLATLSEILVFYFV